MELHTTFSRRVGAGTDPVLGTDAVPTGLPAIGVGADLLRNIVRCLHPFVADNPVQRIALFYRYTGGGPAPVVPLTAYCYVRETDSWFQVGPVVNLTDGVVAFIDSIAGILPMQSMPSVANLLQGASPGDSTSSLEVVLVPSAPAGAPAGTYTFGALFDSSLAGGDADNDFALILAQLVALNAKSSLLNLEATQLKVLWGQSGSTAPTAVAVPDGVKVSAATPVAPAVYAGAGLNGANIVAGALTAPRNVSVTTAVHAATYKVGAPNAIVVSGIDYYTKLPVSEALILVAAGGGETISGVVLFDAASISIAVPAQNDALGAFEFGTGTSAPGTQHMIPDALPPGAATLTSDVDVTTVAGAHALAAGACAVAEVQADPTNGADVRIGGTGTDATHGFVLEAGQSYSVAVQNTSQILYYSAAGGETLHVVRRS